MNEKKEMDPEDRKISKETSKKLLDIKESAREIVLESKKRNEELLAITRKHYSFWNRIRNKYFQ